MLQYMKEHSMLKVKSSTHRNFFELVKADKCVYKDRLNIHVALKIRDSEVLDSPICLKAFV